MHNTQLVPTVEMLDGQPKTTSLAIAEHFDKRHADILRAIEEILTQVSDSFSKRNFALTSYEIIQPMGGTRSLPMYLMTKNGFSYLVMGFTGAKAAQWKEAYITAFDQMYQALQGDPAKLIRQLDLKILRELNKTNKHFAHQYLIGLGFNEPVAKPPPIRTAKETNPADYRPISEQPAPVAHLLPRLSQHKLYESALFWYFDRASIETLCSPYSFRETLRFLKAQGYLKHDKDHMTAKTPYSEKFGGIRRDLFTIRKTIEQNRPDSLIADQAPATATDQGRSGAPLCVAPDDQAPATATQQEQAAATFCIAPDDQAPAAATEE